MKGLASAPKRIPSCIALDFDGTLAHFLHGPKGFFEIFTKRGVAHSILEESYPALKEKEGFSIQKLYERIAAKKELSVSGETIEREFQEWLQKELVLYPDSMRALENWQRGRIPVVVLTAGGEEYQKQKIDATHIPYDELCVVPTPQKKVPEVFRLIGVYGTPLAVLDDKVEVLDEVRKEFPDPGRVRTVWVRRAHDPWQENRQGHEEAADVGEASLLLGEKKR